MGVISKWLSSVSNLPIVDVVQSQVLQDMGLPTGVELKTSEPVKEEVEPAVEEVKPCAPPTPETEVPPATDRKSTRLNSSHL